MVFNSLLTENTHFENDVIQENATGYEGEYGCLNALFEATQESQTLFEEVIQIDFVEAAINHGIHPFTEAMLESMIYEADEEDKSDSKKEDKSSTGGIKGLMSKAGELINKLWTSIVSAINKAIEAVRKFINDKCVKFVKSRKIKSKEELKKITYKKYYKYAYEKNPELQTADEFLAAVSTLSKLAEEGKTSEKDFIKLFCKQINTDDIKKFKEYITKRIKGESSEVTLDTVIDEAKETLINAKSIIDAYNECKKNANRVFKEFKKQEKAKSISVKKNGSYKVTDDEGHSVEAKVDDKDAYAKEYTALINAAKAFHKCTMASLNTAQSLVNEHIRQSMAIFAKGSYLLKKDDSTKEEPKTDDQAKETMNTEGFEVPYEDDDALLEFCGYEVEMGMQEAYYE